MQGKKSDLLPQKGRGGHPERGAAGGGGDPAVPGAHRIPGAGYFQQTLREEGIFPLKIRQPFGIFPVLGKDVGKVGRDDLGQRGGSAGG